MTLSQTEVKKCLQYLGQPSLDKKVLIVSFMLMADGLFYQLIDDMKWSLTGSLRTNLIYLDLQL